MKLLSLVLAFVLVLFQASLVSVEAINWYTDWEKAKRAASDEQKPIFIYFTGSDWSTWCQKMETEILSTPQFAQELGDKCIFMRVDFPMAYWTRRGFDPKVALEIEYLRNVYGVHPVPGGTLLGPNGFGVPLVSIVNTSLQRVGYLEYVRGGPAAFDPKIQALIRKCEEATIDK